jgi:hypothetical protein
MVDMSAIAGLVSSLKATDISKAAMIVAVCSAAVPYPALAAGSRIIEIPEPPPSEPMPPVTPQPPAVSPLDQPNSKPNQQKIAPDNRGTEQSPFVVKTVPPEKTREENKREEEKAEIDHETVRLTRDLVDYTWLLFIATGVLAGATGGLALVAFFQMRDARQAIQATVTSANAAVTSAQAADRHIVHAFPPKIVVRRISLNKLEIGEQIEIEFIVGNEGRAPGTIMESNATVYIRQEGTLPAIPPYSVAVATMGTATVRPGPGQPVKVYSLMPLTEAEYDRIVVQLRTPLYLIGYIVYDDELEVRRHMAFGREYNFPTQRFHPVNDANYEYGE